MATLKRILLWIAAIIVGGLTFIFFTALFQENGQYSIPYVAVLGVALFFIIRALKKPRTGESSNQGAQSVDVLQTVSNRLPRRDGASIVSYQAMSLEESIQVEDYVVVDVETTGLHPETDEIIEVAAIRCIGGRFETFKTLVFPRYRIPEHVTQLTGIRNIDVINAPQIKQVAPKLLDFIRGLPIVAHNAPFDVQFIGAAFAKINADINMKYIDTVQLARVAYPGMQNYKLGTLIENLNLIQGKQQHRAESDAAATLRLFKLCQSEIPNRIAEEHRQREQAQIEEKRLREQAQLEEKVYHLNQFGMQAEAAGNVEKAIGYYEDVLEEKGVIPHSYMRLAVIYKKQHRWEDVVRVCDAALAVLPGTPGKLCQPEEWEKRKAYAISQTNK